MITIQKMIMKWIGIFVICHFLVQTASHEYGIEPDYERPHVFYNQQQITPLILMVDATNRLGFSILKHHALGNSNNIAFSPCGLSSVLVALFEGSDGHSSFEIYQALDVPFDRDVVRIGFRDIHRRLRSYFYQQENVLSGLSLSKENVTIRSGYESILRFYGYDLGNGDEGKDAITTTTESKRREQDEQENVTQMKTASPTELPTTILPDVSTETPTTKFMSEPTITEYDEGELEETTTIKLIPTKSTIIPSTEKPTEVTEAPTKLTKVSVAPTEARTEPSTIPPTEPSTLLPTEPSTEPSTLPPTEASTEPLTETPTEPPTKNPTEPPKLISITTPVTVPRTYPTVTTQLPYLTEITTPFLQTTKYPTTISSRSTYPSTEDSTMLPATEMVSTQRSTMYIFTFKPITTTPIPEPDITTTKRYYNLLTTIPTPSITIRPFTTDSSNAKLLNALTTLPVPTAILPKAGDTSNARLLNVRNSRIYRIKREPTNYNNFIPFAPSGYGISSNVDFYDPYLNYATPNPSDLYYPEGNPIYATKQFEQIEHHQDEIDHFFYLNPRDSIRIEFKVYNTILRFAYIQSIQASALELPLDSENYNLLLIVPDDQPIESLVDAMSSHLSPSLRHIRAALRQRWIQTMIPKFHLKGNVVLTGDLMKIGIHDIFEPNKADFSPMTDEFGIYARHIEQSITINIRTHANNQLRRYAQQFFDPIKVPVNRPFIFAIIDNELDLAIMVGRVLNPINSRIF